MDAKVTAWQARRTGMPGPAGLPQFAIANLDCPLRPVVGTRTQQR
jgi:hypothetical protein